ncbi:MAG: ArsR family transcriptional regulator [Mycobacterium sp.]
MTRRRGGIRAVPAGARSAAAPVGKPKLGLRQVKLAQQMYDEKDEYGKRRYTVEQIAAEFGVTRPTIYRHLGKMSAADRRVT